MDGEECKLELRNVVGLFCEAQVGQKEPLRETVNKADNRPSNRR